ncbi:MAG: HAD family hydrolase [Waddliaceae bacterium]
MKGLLALDIDGTLTSDTHSIPIEVVNYLESLTSEGWRVFVITGRSFGFALPLLQDFAFPYYLAVHNGATILEMPNREILKKEYLNPQIFSAVESVCAAEPTDFVIYTGMENQDICYYRPTRFDTELLGYVEKRAAAFQENWKAVGTFKEVVITDFPTVKCFGKIESMRRVAQGFEKKLGLHAPVIRDPFGEDVFLTLATKCEVSKGGAVQILKKLAGCSGPVIAAGDDYNDLSMLEEADFKIVMETAPQELKKYANLVAPSAEGCGIISALEQAIKNDWSDRV